jgi:hypothetical protein
MLCTFYTVAEFSTAKKSLKHYVLKDVFFTGKCSNIVRYVLKVFLAENLVSV